MASIIKLKRSLTPGSVPESLEAGELAINIADKKLFSSNGSSVFNVSGDQYNLTSSVGNGGASINLTVDNDALSNDAITFLGGTGIAVSRNANSTITISSTGSVATADALSSAVTVQLTGDVTGSATFTNAGDTASITTTIAENSVALGTDTTGNYLASLTGGTDINVSGGTGEGATPTVNLAGTISANTTGSAAKLTTARTIQISGDQAGSASFDGSGNINIAVTTQNNSVDLGSHTTGNYVASLTAGDGINIAGGTGEGSTPTIHVDATISSNTTGNAATATALATARTIGGVSFDGTANINLPGVNTTGNQDTSGNAATATALATARTIGGVSFDGTANINLPGVNTTGDQDTSGNAATATKLATARTIQISGDQAGSASFDGSGNINIAVTTQSNSVDLGTHTTGNYVAAITGTANEISVSGSGSETASVTIGLPDNVTIGNNLNVTANTSIGGNLTVDGNLEVNGTLTYIDSTTVTIGDNMLKLANTNSSDTVDLGFYALYNSSGNKYTGLVRDASDGEYYLFDGLATEPDQQINFGNASTATLNAVIDGGTF